MDPQILSATGAQEHMPVTIKIKRVPSTSELLKDLPTT